MLDAVYTPAARRDIVSIVDWIAKDSIEAALRMLDAIDAKIQQLRHFPNMGESVERLAPGLRRTSAPPFSIYYRVVNNAIEIDRVVHGARDIEKLLP